MSTICNGCGHEVPPGTNFCLDCGAAVIDPASVTMATAGAPVGVPYSPAPFDAAPPPEDPLLTQLRESLAGDYVVDKEVGRGGMAVVFRAREVNLNRVVALKVLPPEIAMAGGTADRFKREARMSAGLDHPNIIPVYRVGQAGNLHYMAVKFMEGRALDSIVESQGALPLPVVILVLKAAAQALAYAHEHGVIHRDIKGANILVDKDGRVVVADFGIARAQEEASLTASGMIVGTPYFMSPEQCAGHKVGPQSDQYSLGILAFQLLTGEVPFQADSLMGILQHHFMTPAPDIRQVRFDVPEPLVQVVERSLAKRAEDRYASTKDMVQALKAVPFSPEEEHEAERMLRALAGGEAGVEKVRTHSLPPLTQQQLGSPAASATQAFGGRGAPGGATTPTPAGLAAPLAETAESAAPAKARRPRPEVKPASKTPMVVGLLAVLALGGGAAWFFTQKPAPAADASAPPAAATPSAPAVASTGTLRFQSLPEGATVTIDGRPAQGENAGLEAGMHRFTVTAPGFEPWSSNAEVKAGETAVLTANLAPKRVAETPRPAAPRPAAAAEAAPAGPPGKVRIAANPLEATIYIDGRQIGVGRALDVSIPSGRRRLRVAAPGYETYEETITVNAGETTTKPVTLKPQGG